MHLWNSATGTEQATLSATNEPVWSVTLTSDGRIALTAHDLGELHLWDVTNRKHLRNLAASAKRWSKGSCGALSKRRATLKFSADSPICWTVSTVLY